jgi:PAS domain S-box-containing protein
MLKTVKVPKEFEPVFKKAETYVKNYFKQKSANPSKGTIEIFGERYILLRAASMSTDFFEITKNLYKDYNNEETINITRSLLFDISHAIGKMDARNFHKKMNLTNPIEKLSAGPIHFSHSGWAFVDIFLESKPTPDENYYLIYDHPFSFESDTWIRKGKKSDFPVCAMNAGYSSGWCEESFGIPLVAYEILCKAKGDDVCRFIMAQPSKIEQYIQQYLKKEPKLAESVTKYKIASFSTRKELAMLHRLAMIVEQTTEGVVVTDLEGKIVFVNAAWVKMHGYNYSDELIGKNLSIFHTDKQMKTDVIPIISEVNRTGNRRDEIGHMRKNGTAFPTEMSVILLKDDEGVPVGLVGLAEDISLRKKAEEALRQEKNRAQSYLNIAGVMMVAIEPNQKTILVNKKTCEVLGCQAKDVIGKNWFDMVIPEESRDRIKAVFNDLIAGEIERWEYIENPVLTSRGEERLIAWHNTILRDDDGKIIATLSSGEDITDYRRAEEKIKEAVEIKSRFVSMVSHELRTPLTAMKNAISLILDGATGEFNEKQGKFLEIAKRNIDRLANLINDVLDFQKLCAGRMELNIQPNDIKEIVAEVREIMVYHANKANIDFSIEFEKGVPKARFDSDKIIQVLTNLVNNAIKFTPEGGKVSIGVKHTDEELAISVSDTGMGIPKEELPKIFGQFYRVERPGQQIKGTGLGLAIVEKIVKLHGGRFEVESELGEGTTFTVFLPLEAKALPEVSPEETDELVERTFVDN